jgi:hypothetical protein
LIALQVDSIVGKFDVSHNLDRNSRRTVVVIGRNEKLAPAENCAFDQEVTCGEICSIRSGPPEIQTENVLGYQFQV